MMKETKVTRIEVVYIRPQTSPEDPLRQDGFIGVRWSEDGHQYGVFNPTEAIDPETWAGVAWKRDEDGFQLIEACLGSAGGDHPGVRLDGAEAMTERMLVTVARAVTKVIGDSAMDTQAALQAAKLAVPIAEAAIRAMRLPTPAMIEAGAAEADVEDHQIERAFTLMIDEALKP